MKKSSALKPLIVSCFLVFSLVASVSVQGSSLSQLRRHAPPRIMPPLPPLPGLIMPPTPIIFPIQPTNTHPILPIFFLTNCTPAPAGLVGWWKGDGNGNDSAGTNNATVPDGVTYVPAELGQGFNLDGQDHRILVPDAPELNFSSNQDFSIEVWIQPLTNPGNWQDVMSIIDKRIAPDTITQLGYELNLQGGVVYFQMDDTLVPYRWNIFSGGSDLRDGQFHHVAVTVQRNSTSGGQIYVDGQVVLTFDPTVCPGDLSNTEPLRIGNHATPDVEAFYHGIIDEVSLYHRALSSNEIASIYRAGSAGKCPVAPPTCVSPPSGLVGWWPGEGNANDNVGLNNGLLENVAFANGKVGQAFYLNGSDADVKIPASSSLDVGSGDGFTLEAWINPSDVSQRYPLFEWNVGDGTTYWGVHFYIDPVSFGAGPGALYANIVDNYGSWHQLHTDAGVVATNVFQHVALTYDKASGVATIYCNGVAVAQQNLGSFTPLTTYDLYLGKRPLTQGETYAFAGLLDEPSVYNRALSPTEIASIYQAGSAGKCAESVPPAITVQPVNQTTVEGSNVVLSVVVGGTGPFSYQWCFTTNTAFITDPLIHLFFNGTNIPGATNATLTLTNLHPYQSGCYAVTITTPSGIIASSGASVTVIARNILVYNYSGTEKITTAGQAFAYAYSGQMFFIPDSTSGAFVGWGTINGEKQYWVNSLSDYLLIAIPGATNQTITILGRAGQEIDADSCPHIWSYLHKGQNTQLTIGAKKYFSFPNTFRGEAIHVYPDSQTGNPILNESSSKYTFAPQNTQTANNNGQTLTDLIGTLTNTLASQGYQKQ